MRQEIDRPIVVAVDFDGTIVEQNGMYPEFGQPLPMALPALRSMCLDKRYSVYIYSLRDSSQRSNSVKLMADQFLIKNRIKATWACEATRGIGKFPYDVLIDDKAYPNKVNDKYLWSGVIFKFGLTIRPSSGESCLFNIGDIDIPEIVESSLVKEAKADDISFMLERNGTGYLMTKLNGSKNMSSYLFDSNWNRNSACTWMVYG